MDLDGLLRLGGFGLAVLVPLGAAYKWIHGIRVLRLERDRQMLEYLYGPLVSLLLDIHLEASTLTMYPTLRQRLRHALEVFAERRYLKSKITGFFRALNDKGISGPSVGVEFGASFPTTEIGNILKKHPHLARTELLDLYQAATRDEYEGIGGEITAAHLELHEHIYREHERLSKRVY